METRVEIATSGTAKAEIATIIHNGKEFSSLGSVVDKASGYVAGYVSSDGQWLTTWQGERIAPLRKVSTWKVRSAIFGGYSMSAYRATIEGRVYHGRGQGEMMLLRMRATKGGK